MKICVVLTIVGTVLVVMATLGMTVIPPAHHRKTVYQHIQYWNRLRKVGLYNFFGHDCEAYHLEYVDINFESSYLMLNYSF